ncbi:MAG: DUF1080 domain-containing protein [bacterium]|nr:DUF1080 domain-containing protein [bacterium]
MNTLQASPPKDATVLFNGKDLSNWSKRGGGTPEWKVDQGILHVVSRTGDIVSNESFTDFYLHIEFRCPDMPEATGQAKGNSGIFLHGIYEIQVLDSSGINIPGKGDCGAFYDQFAPLANACKPALEWQAYDIFFRAPRLSATGEMVENPRATVLLNGIVAQNNVQLLGPTGSASNMDIVASGPLRLQDHKDLVAYRNIWAVPLPEKGSDTYEPR